MIDMIIILLLLIFICLYTSGNCNKYAINENYENMLSIDKIGIPLIMREPNKDVKELKDESVYVFNEKEFYELIDKQPTVPLKNNYEELPDYEYDYSKKLKIPKINENTIKKIVNGTFIKIKDYVEKEANKKEETCNKILPCLLKLDKYTILKIGYSKNGTISVEGQLLLSFYKRDSMYLVQFVSSTEDNVSLHNVKHIGYDIKSNNYNKGVKDDIFKSDNLEIENKPFFNKYRGNMSDLVTGEYMSIVPKEDEVDKYLKKREEIERSEYKCYGNNGITQIECEKEKGVWDKDCLNDYECPFFKSNKNYPNEFGGCKAGKCVLPLGVKSISPRKYMDIEKAVCYNCGKSDKGLNCCMEQNDKDKYPKLKSPDYKFVDDMKARIEYKMGLI